MRTGLTLIVCFMATAPQSADAVYIASDRLFLYENNRRITDDSVIVRHDLYSNGTNLHFEICWNGTYDRGQQFSGTLIFFKTSEPNLLDYQHWSNSYVAMKGKHCVLSEVQSKEWRKAHPECKYPSQEEYKAYLQDYMTRASYSKEIMLPKPEDRKTYGGGTHNGVPVLGGRVGSPRNFNVDLKSGTIILQEGKPSPEK